MALEGLTDGAEGGAPKKSKPRRESPCFCCLGGAATSFGGGGRTLGVSVVLGRAGGVGISPNRSIFGAGFGTGFVGWLGVEETRCEVERSILALSWTTLSGWRISISNLPSVCVGSRCIRTISSSPSASKVEGSGIGPSMTQRFDSYFVRMKFSILLVGDKYKSHLSVGIAYASDGTCPGASFDSQYLSSVSLLQLGAGFKRAQTCWPYYCPIVLHFAIARPSRRRGQPI